MYTRYSQNRLFLFSRCEQNKIALTKAIGYVCYGKHMNRSMTFKSIYWTEKKETVFLFQMRIQNIPNIPLFSLPLPNPQDCAIHAAFEMFRIYQIYNDIYVLL